MRRVALLLFEGCDLVDVAGPYEVLLTASRLAVRRDDEAAFDVRTVSVDGGPVTAYGGMGLVPSHGAAADVGRLDVLVVPGLVDLGLADEASLLDAVRAAASSSGIVASVCTGSFVLAAAGLLGDRPATTHAEDAAALAARRGAGTVRTDVRWVDDGDVVTAGGMLSGVDMALHLVARLVDRDLALATSAQMDHVWTHERPLDAPGRGPGRT